MCVEGKWAGVRWRVATPRNLHDVREIRQIELGLAALDLAVLDGGVIQVRVQLDSLVRSSAVLVLHGAVTVRARL